MSIKQIDYKGKQVVYADFRGLKKMDEQIAKLEELGSYLAKGSNGMLVIDNFEGISVGPEFMSRLKELGKRYSPKIKRNAVLGITGLKTVLMQGYLSFTGQENVKAFDNESEALDWLIR